MNSTEMSPATLKSELHNFIDSTDDVTILEEIKMLFNISISSNQEISVGEKHVEKANKAQKEVDNGDWVSDEVANQQVEAWLAK